MSRSAVTSEYEKNGVTILHASHIFHNLKKKKILEVLARGCYYNLALSVFHSELEITCPAASAGLSRMIQMFCWLVCFSVDGCLTVLPTIERCGKGCGNVGEMYQ
uniref:Uncharacterized protein n=1 Tax=Rhipicephalus zambeziensis TaxID=60191 RepID=A0A224YFS3_9ACAR